MIRYAVLLAILSALGCATPQVVKVRVPAATPEPVSGLDWAGHCVTFTEAQKAYSEPISPNKVMRAQNRAATGYLDVVDAANAYKVKFETGEFPAGAHAFVLTSRSVPYSVDSPDSPGNKITKHTEWHQVFGVDNLGTVKGAAWVSGAGAVKDLGPCEIHVQNTN